MGNLDDCEMLEEIYQTTVNVTRADYQAMFEARSLARSAYVIMAESLEFQEEAIHGELSQISLLRACLDQKELEASKPEVAQRSFFWSSTPKVSQSKSSPSPACPECPRKRQLRSCFNVALAYIHEQLGMPRSITMKLLHRCVGLKSLIFQW